MSAPSLSDAALGVGGRIGRYFSIVTLVPSLFLTLWTCALFASDAWAREPDLHLLGTRFGGWTVSGVAWVLFAAVLVGLFIHPLQFPTTQLLEGYWGTSPLARGAAHLRAVHYRRKVRRLEQWVGEHQNAVNDAFDAWCGPRAATLTDEEREDRKSAFLDSARGDPVMAHLIAIDAFSKRMVRFPAPVRMLPTRLGNALRVGEDTAGQQYGLDAITTAPHLAVTATERHNAYKRDAQEQLDAAIRLCSVSLVATVVTVPAVLTDGWWLLVALIPYGLAWIAYRAAVSAADEYMTAVATVIDLDRFTLYTQLGLTKPRDTEEERTVNAELMGLLRGDPTAELTYDRTAQPPRPLGLYRPSRRLRPSVDVPVRRWRAR